MTDGGRGKGAGGREGLFVVCFPQMGILQHVLVPMGVVHWRGGKLMTWKGMTGNLGVMFLRRREELDQLTRGGVSLNKNEDD